MKKMNCILVILSLSLVCVIIFLLVGRNNNNLKNILPTDEDAEEWTGDQNLPNGEIVNDTIQVPGYDTLTFNANSLNQKVNFCNPDTNNCVERMTLFIEDKKLWQSVSYVSPGHGFYDITLDEVLDKGEYEAYLLAEFFTKDGTQLNTAKVEFKIKAEEL